MTLPSIRRCSRSAVALGMFAMLSLWAIAQEPQRIPGVESSEEDLTLECLKARLDSLEWQNQDLQRQLRQLTGDSDTELSSYSADVLNASAASTEKADKKPVWKINWNNGLEFATDDKQFRVHIGGRTQLDTVWYVDTPSAFVGTGGIAGQSHSQDAVAFRRARLRADGTIFATIDYVAEYDFANSLARDSGGANNTEGNTINVTAPTDLWFNFKELPVVGNLRVGNVKEPFGFEHNTSSRFLNFMERSFLQDLFAGPFNNGFTPGLLLHNTFDDQHGTWAVGVFKNNYFNVFAYDVGNGEYATTGRLTYTPIFDEENHQVLHVGVAGSYRDPDGSTLRFRTRDLRNGPANLATVFADTGTFTAGQEWMSGAELAGVWGPLSFQAEWMGAWALNSATLAGSKALAPAGTNLGTTYVNGYYAEVHYFLTGETREYERKAGAFGRVVPLRNFSTVGDCIEPGAWQIAFRYGNTDLNNGALNGGLLHEYTVGLNWFLNPNTKIQTNYACLVRNSVIDAVNDGVIHGFGMRLAFDF